MKKITLLLIVTVAFLFVGCEEKPKGVVDKAGKSISEVTNKAVKAVRESAE